MKSTDGGSTWRILGNLIEDVLPFLLGLGPGKRSATRAPKFLVPGRRG